MVNAIKRFVRDESGLETVEWAIVGGLVVAVGAIVFTLIGSDVQTSLENLQTVTADAATQSGS
jgi:Flp pilus assembly pilin Flp